MFSYSLGYIVGDNQKVRLESYAKTMKCLCPYKKFICKANTKIVLLYKN